MTVICDSASMKMMSDSASMTMMCGSSSMTMMCSSAYDSDVYNNDVWKVMCDELCY